MIARRLPAPRLWTLLAMLLIAGVALALRLKRIDESLTLDIKHFIEFAETLFTGRHFDYYAGVSGHEFTYAHLPVFPHLLAPVLRLFRALGLDDLHAIKAIAYAADLGAAYCLYLLGRRQGLARLPALALLTLWLFHPRVVEASVGQAHVVSLAVLFMFLALLRKDVPWQAGLFWALAVATRTEFIFLALAAAVHYGVHRRAQFRGFLFGAVAVFAVFVLPYLIRDFEALRWGVYGHLSGRGDGLPLFRAIFDLLGRPFPDALVGPNDWYLRIAAPVVIALTAFDRKLQRVLLAISLVFVLSLMVVHARYLVMPLSLAAVYAARPGLIWIFVAWYAIDAPTALRPDQYLLGLETGQLLWVVILVALYAAAPIRRYVEARLPAAVDLSNAGSAGGR
jgi:hypothetical protein